MDFGLSLRAPGMTEEGAGPSNQSLVRPLNMRKQRDLADYHFISITEDYDPELTTYDVNLSGNKGTEPITLQSFARREEADKLASEIGRVLRLPARDDVGTEPESDDAA